MSEKIMAGSQVRLLFSLTLEDGTWVDGTEDGEPMDFQMGDGTMIEGLELAILGLGEGDKQAVSIPPESGFGFPDPDNVHALPLSDFSAELLPEPGLIMSFDLPNGDQVPGTVVEVGNDSVKVDFSHPLAGHETVFSVQILEVENPGPDLKAV